MPQSFDDLLSQVRALGADLPEFEDLCDRLGRAHSDATGDAFFTGSEAALGHLILGVRYDGGDVDDVDWYGARRLGQLPWGFHRHDRRDVFEWMAERTGATPDDEAYPVEAEAHGA